MTAVGVGWRPEIDLTVERLRGVDFVEVIAESVDPARLPESLRVLRERGVGAVPHGVGLSLGSAERPDPRRLTHLAACARALDAPVASEHIAFVRAGEHEAGHLLPVPRTREAVDVIAENVRIAQDALGVPLALENVAAIIEWPEDELTETQFLGEILDRTGALLLLDVANLHTARVNFGSDPMAALDALPLDRIAYVHVAGGIERDGVWHDTHTHPVTPPIMEILAALAQRVAPPGVLLERDGDYPSTTEWASELTAIRTVIGRSGTGDAPGLPEPPRFPIPMPPQPTLPGPTLPGPTQPGPTQPKATAPEVRDTLGRAQAHLVAALAGDAAPPEGFVADRVSVQRAALIRKRADGVARCAPALVEELGERFGPLFHDYACATPKPAGGTHADTDAFAARLRGAGALPRPRGPLRRLVTAARRPGPRRSSDAR